MRQLSFNPIERQAPPRWAYWDNAFNEAEIEKLIQLGNALPVETGMVLTNEDEGLGQDKGVRNSQIAWFYPTHEHYSIFERVGNIVASLNSKFYEFDLTGFRSMQYTVYTAPGGLYQWHLDAFPGFFPEDGEPRKLSVIMALSDPSSYEGGLFQFAIRDQENPATVELPLGRLIVFPSWLMHRVTPVTKGIRRTLVTWIVGPKFR